MRDGQRSTTTPAGQISVAPAATPAHLLAFSFVHAACASLGRLLTLFVTVYHAELRGYLGVNYVDPFSADYFQQPLGFLITHDELDFDGQIRDELVKSLFVENTVSTIARN